MGGQLFTSTSLDVDGRQLLLDNVVLGTYYYSTVGETWDKSGSAAQSWYREVYLPNDTFDAVQVFSAQWDVVDTTVSLRGGACLESGVLKVEVVRDEGIGGLSSDGKWRFTGDFDIRLYIDWDSYYNEYRSIAHTFFKVGFDNSNAIRITFTFDGTDSFGFSSEKTVGRSLQYFDWQDNGDLLELDAFGDSSAYTYFKITRYSGVIKTYVSTGEVDTQVGESLSDAVFSGDLFVEMGAETKEYNTYRSAFTKFFVAEGEISPGTEFFSSVRGRRQSFPERAIFAVDAQSLSVIDEDSGKLWMRFMLGGESPLPLGSTSVCGCNGTIYCATFDGLIAFDFHRDKIYKYKGSTLYVADEPLAMRNSAVTFRTYLSNIGTLPDNDLYSVACREVGSDNYIAVSHDYGVSVMRALASGVANCTDGPIPGSKVYISDGDVLFWAGYDYTVDEGDISYYSSVGGLSCSGTISFSRTGYYNTSTPYRIFTPHVTCFDAVTVGGEDCLAVGTSEGLSFISSSSSARYTGSFSYGPTTVADNPVADPSFEGHLGVSWGVGYTGLHQKFFATRENTFSGAGSYCLKMRFDALEVQDQEYLEDTAGRVYQNVDFTGLAALYFDIKIVCSVAGIGNIWDFEVIVGDTIVKRYRDIDGPFIKYTDSIDVSAFGGIQQLVFRIRVVEDTASVSIDTREVYVDNIKFKTDDPDFRILPAGSASILEVLLQYDNSGHKIYFSTAEGYGAVDLDIHSLDYFTSVETYVSGAEVVSAAFARVDEDGV